MELEIDDLERRAIEKSLAERRSRLIEKAGDTTLTPARRQASYRELSAIASALPKLRRAELRRMKLSMEEFAYEALADLHTP